MNISLTPKLEELIKHKVDSGHYSNASEVVGEALRLMDEHTQLVEQMKLARLQNEVAKGAVQAERGEFSKHSINTLLEDLNSRELDKQLSISPRSRSWDDFFDSKDQATSDFMTNRVDPPAQKRELF